MASSRKPTYKVDTTVVTERKRRKSDLVLMWQSILDVTTIIVKELWMAVLRAWEYIHLWFSSSEKLEIQAWLEKYLSFAPEDFSHSWRDGQLLGILLNKLQPGCFPEANRLDPDYGLRNVYKVFDVLEMYFGIKPNVSVEEIVTCIEGSEQKLLEILLKLKELTDNKPQKEESITENEEKNSAHEPCISHCCIAKGTGLAVGFVGRIANFIIFCALMTDLDIVIEIKGPSTVCSERITKKSPKKRRSVIAWEYSRPIRRSVSFCDKISNSETAGDTELDERIIPLEYEIIGNQISLSYKPKEKGNHTLAILWHGQHVSDSPYTVTVNDPSEIVGANNLANLKSAMKSENEQIANRKISVRFQESHTNCKELKKHFGRVRSRKILRYIVSIQGEDVVINAENTECLAAELLKMDYDFENYPSFHRRNSWGFAGDAERKRSVIRQFGIDVNELEAQCASRRSRSLSVQTGDKNLLEKSGSLDNLTDKLAVVNEDILEIIHDEREEDYAYINEDSLISDDSIDVRNGNEPELQSIIIPEEGINPDHENNFLKNISTENCNEKEENYASMNEDFLTMAECTEEKSENDSELQNMLIPNEEPIKYDHESNSLKNFSFQNHLEKNVKRERISSSSIYVDEINVDDSNEDLERKYSSSSPLLWSNNDSKEGEILGRKSIQLESSNMKIIDNNPVSMNFSFTFPRYSQLSSSKNILNNDLKLKRILNGRKYIPLYRRNMSGKIRAINKRKKTTSRIKISKMENSAFLSYITALRKRYAKNKYRKNTYPNSLPSCKLKDLKCSSEKYEISRNIDNTNDSFSKHLNIPLMKSFNNAVNDENNKFSQAKNKFLIENNEEKNASSVSYSRNVADIYKDMKDIGDTRESTMMEPPVLKHSINKILKSEMRSVSTPDMKTRDINILKQKQLRTHTLKRLEQFHFTQFNPFPEVDGSVRPVKSQIIHWERSFSADSQQIPLKKCTVETELGNVREKLAFWENAQKTESKSSKQNTSNINEELILNSNQKRKNSSALGDLQPHHGTGTDLPKNNS